MNWEKKNIEEGFVLWFTGLSASGKTKVADMVAYVLEDYGKLVERLDGDVVRDHLTSDLGFTADDRNENIKRNTFVAKILERNGVCVVASFISPYRERRRKTREECDNFIEVYTKCPVEVCVDRDPKGLYEKAKKGEIDNFTGISDPYEEPKNPEVVIDTHKEAPLESVMKVLNFIYCEVGL